MKLITFFLTISTIFMQVALSSVQKEFSIMSYNVENLFDAVHDEQKNDWEFLPLDYPGKKEACAALDSKYRGRCEKSHWSKDHMVRKIKSLSAVVKSNSDKLPDILALQEVENERVVELLAKELGYINFYVTSSPDERGIDVAILFNERTDLKLLSIKDVQLNLEKVNLRPTRNILLSRFLIGEEKYTIFVNHWPSQANPTSARLLAAKKIKKLIKKRKFFSPKEHFIAVGDFNVIDNEYPHPFRNILSKGKRGLIDVQTTCESDNQCRDHLKRMPRGSYFYVRGMSWNKLDRVFVSKSLLDQNGAEADISSFRIVASSFFSHDFTYNRQSEYGFGTTIKGIPYRFQKDLVGQVEDEKSIGASDHFPVYVKIKY